jgi:hypothetical protein
MQPHEEGEEETGAALHQIEPCRPSAFPGFISQSRMNKDSFVRHGLPKGYQTRRRIIPAFRGDFRLCREIPYKKPQKESRNRFVFVPEQPETRRYAPSTAAARQQQPQQLVENCRNFLHNGASTNNVFIKNSDYSWRYDK